MTGLFLLLILLSYYYLSKFIVNKTFEFFKTKKAKYIAMAIMILIPTWDIVLGYPIYWYLCNFKAGVKIYKSIDNVEGFYVGELDKDFPYTPYKGYFYKDYFDKNNKYFYRNYLVDNNSSNDCINIEKHFSEDYAKLVIQGKCIVRKEINENILSLYEYKRERKINNYINFLGIYKTVSEKIINRKTGELLSEVIEYSWNEGWFIKKINEYILLKMFKYNRKFELNEGYINTLKPIKGKN